MVPDGAQEVVARLLKERTGVAGTEEFFVRPTWEQFARIHLVWPLVVNVIMTVVLLKLRYVYSWAHKSSRFERFILNFIGTNTRPDVDYPIFLVVVNAGQFITSSLQVFNFLVWTYDLSEGYDHILELVITGYNVFCYLVQRLQEGMRPSTTWSFVALIDVFTLAPDFLPRHADWGWLPRNDIWLSLKYLRIYSAWRAYGTLAELAGLQQLSEIGVFALGFVMRSLSLVVIMGGTIFGLEVLGEVPFFADDGPPSALNEGRIISMTQMCYWMVTTISTVGYGDFSPQTVPSRIAVTIFIVLGCIFFGSQIEALNKMQQTDHAGLGKYIGQGHHLILAGPGVSHLSTMLQTLILEMANSEEGHPKMPDVVFLSPKDYDPALISFITGTLPPQVQAHICLLRGTIMSGIDQMRARVGDSRLVFIMPGASPHSALEEDSRNILRCLEILRVFPQTRIRTILLEEQSKSRAISLGIPAERCFSLRGLTASLMAHSIRVKGLVPLLCGLLQNISHSDLKSVFGARHLVKDSWPHQYAMGLSRRLYGLVVGEDLAGLAFPEAIAKVYEESKGEVLLVAGHVAGKLVLVFDGPLEAGQVVICIGTGQQDVSRFGNSHWTEAFMEARRGAVRERLRKGEVGAVQTAGSMLPRSLSSITQRIEARKSAVSLQSDEASLREDRSAKETYREISNHTELEHHLKSNGLRLLVVVEHGAAGWGQCLTILERLRDAYLLRWKPIVVLAETEPPSRIAEEFGCKHVAFVAGPLFEIKTLKRCGIEEAESVILISGAGEAFGSSMTLADHKVVALGNLIDRCEQKGARPRTTVREFGNTGAVELISSPLATAWSAAGKPVILEHGGSKYSLDSLHAEANRNDEKAHQSHLMTNSLSEWEKSNMASVRDLGMQREQDQVLRQLRAWLKHPIEAMRRKTDGASKGFAKVLLEPRFASGEVFTPDFFGAMLGHIFHFPATIEFIECVVQSDHTAQFNFPWQVRCPELWVGRTYGELVSSWARCEDPALREVGAAVLVLALFRQVHGEKHTGFNVTLPPPSTVLLKTDRITVLAPIRFDSFLRSLEPLTEKLDHREESLEAFIPNERPDDPDHGETWQQQVSSSSVSRIAT